LCSFAAAHLNTLIPVRIHELASFAGKLRNWLHVPLAITIGSLAAPARLPDAQSDAAIAPAVCQIAQQSPSRASRVNCPSALPLVHILF
jgi:hypothetical protein